MPVDVPEEDWATLQIVFATSDGDVRVARVDGTTVSAVVVDGDARRRVEQLAA